MQKVRCHDSMYTPFEIHLASTVCRHPVSDLFHSSTRGSFHLSLTVLVRYRSLGSTQAWRVVPPSSDRIPRAPSYSRNTAFLPLQDFHLLRSSFPANSSYSSMFTGLIRVRSPLLAESRLISFPTGTQMFQFPAFASYHYVFMTRYSLMLWVFPFGYSRIKDCSHLPATFRSVLRPSSPPSVQASTKCPFCACFVKSQNLNDRILCHHINPVLSAIMLHLSMQHRKKCLIILIVITTSLILDIFRFTLFSEHPNFLRQVKIDQDLIYSNPAQSWWR